MESTTFFARQDRPATSFASVFKMSNLSKDVQQHLVQVYTSLAMTVAAATGGVMFYLATGIGGFLMVFVSMFVLYQLMATPRQPEFLSKRRALLLAFGFCDGLAIAPLVQLALAVDAGIVVQALAGTASIFACFSAAALFAERRSWLFVGGMLSSAISTLMMLSLFNFFFPSPFTMQLRLYLGLITFSFYVIYDTQMIVEKATLGDRDAISHAVELFIDFVAIFVRILIILIKNSKNNNNNNSKKRRS